MAKGRDGQTDIYGLIHRPLNFDANKTYPVIESIYAGPHGAHVSKSFTASSGRWAMADLGFVIVQIDHDIPVFLPFVPGNGNLSSTAEFRMEPEPA